MSDRISTPKPPPPGPKNNQPPEERFWKKYSPHHEAPLSGVTSFFIHGLVIALLLSWAFLMAKLGLAKKNDPLPTMENLSRLTGIPVGALIRYVLVKYAASSSDARMALLARNPIVFRQMREHVERAEEDGGGAGKGKRERSQAESETGKEAGARKRKTGGGKRKAACAGGGRRGFHYGFTGLTFRLVDLMQGLARIAPRFQE